MATLPLDELKAGATVRFTVIDGVQYLSIRDLIMVVCGKNQNDSGEVWRKLSRGQSEQPVITFPGAVKLCMFLPGESAKGIRAGMTDILVKYYAGDQDLMEAALANRRSQSPVAVMARAALHADEASLQAQERLSALDAQSAHTTGVKLDNVRKFTEVMGRIDPEWVKDARLKLQLADWAKKCAFKTVLALTAGDDEASTQNEAISVSEVAKAMGVTLSRSQLLTVGKRTKWSHLYYVYLRTLI